MRKDALGLLWEDIPPPPKEKCTPPPRTWEHPLCLPGLDEARAFPCRLFTGPELEEARRNGETMSCDVECYTNYFLVAFKSMESGRVVYFEMVAGQVLNVIGLRWVLQHFQIITFNGNGYDLPVITLALNGATCEELKHASDLIIRMDFKPWQVLKSFNVKPLQLDHIDLIEVAPLSSSLKTYAGRLHAKRMKDLPFPPEVILSWDQITILRWYCINDLDNTQLIKENLQEQLEVRAGMSHKYGVDLRSKSDAQVAEAVIVRELKRINQYDSERPEILPGTSYNYKVPEFIRFQSPEMQQFVNELRFDKFVVSEKGKVITPDSLIAPECRAFTDEKKRKKREVTIAGRRYQVGIGGLHSMESCATHRASEQFRIIDRDVTSYYPSIILNQGLFPKHLGSNFLYVYRSIVERRLEAKRTKNNVEADMLKIVINGSFGKFGSKYSMLYSPDLLIQVTLTGQLSLLMLIEWLELSGIQVVSANTDGVVFKYPRVMQATVDAVVAAWEKATSFGTEETEYAAVFSRDVNNYLALKTDGKWKGKGAYANPWDDPKLAIFRFHKNPATTICIEAAKAWLAHGTSPAVTIRNCGDIRKFVAVRNVKGGAVKNGEYLGKVVRWYYAAGETGNMIYASSGNKVPDSDGGRPIMDLPESMPLDIDFHRYEAETLKIVREIGAL